ncbi:PEPxxWA-CTERM sorting domain-containing protein [Sphingobium sp. H33]|uniref:PEPxxWA-CTERM sorting domain-containing protein n=2 Tax=Sphingobium nicotianae TaxID=2782607 RepID=A0A9X1DEY0_9SPHN|nr:PEPxxWA-CTERM sorting domain-containing protein [Sphingobium nicotianae]
MKIVSYGGGAWAEVGLTPDGSGTYDLAISPVFLTLSGGPEGFVYVDGANAGFNGLDSLLVSEYGAGKVGLYAIDANGDPIVGSRRDFLTGLGGAEGAVIDPLTGDFLFSTFGGGDQVVVVSGFLAPPPSPGVPEPATWALMLVGFGLIGHGLRQARRRTTISFA